MHLTSTDLAQLQAALQVLLAPLDHPDMNRWCAAVCQSTRGLLAADRAMLALPVQGSNKFFGEAVEIEKFEQFESSHRGSLDRQFDVSRRVRDLQVWSRELLFGGGLAQMYRSAYYHDFIVPNRFHDPIGVTVEVEAGRTASLYFHHDQEHGTQFSQREMELLRCLVPAFKAGVQTILRAGEHRSSLAALLDTFREGLQLCDRQGRVLHVNAALVRLLERELEGERLRQEAGRIVKALQSLQDGGASGGGAGQGPLIAEVCTAAARYRLRGSYAGARLAGSEGMLLVAIECLTLQPPTAETLRERFGLTRQEAAVALLLARGKSSAEIARELFISSHTARRHTERVLPKLGVHSRAEVAGRILSG